jgi:hypothetical protein
MLRADLSLCAWHRGPQRALKCGSEPYGIACLRRRHRARIRRRELPRGQQRGRTVTSIRMHMLHRAAIIIHVQGIVGVVVVIGILAMHNQVLQIISLLRR